MAFFLRSLAFALASSALVAAQEEAYSPYGGDESSGPSPAYNYMFQFPLHIPPIASPDYTETTSDGRTINFFSTTIENFTQQIYPDLGPANLVGFNGTAPGPTYFVEKGTETIIRYLNNGVESAGVHLHGSYTHAPWDGWASDEVQIGQWKDYYYPNTENARPIWYHAHPIGHTSTDAYYGQDGIYIIWDPAEDSLELPTGKYDVQLAINDKIYQSNGDLATPNGSPINFFGDTIQVNEAPWPYMATEPRKYRLRFFNMALSRPFQLAFVQPNGDWIDFQVIASDSGLFGGPVTTNEITIAMGERYEVVIDFSPYSGQNITLANEWPTNSFVTSYPNTDKVMLFAVGDSVSDYTNNGDVPSTLNGNIQWPAQRTTVDHYFNFQMGGDNVWTINGVDFNDINNRILARPPMGTVELWEIHHTGGPAVHPVHVHLVNFQVVSRSGGSRGLEPYETAGLKDVVLLEPGETVQVLAYYGPWNGVYMFHCHNLIHEDHAMIDAFNVTALAAFGYDFSESMDFADPMDSRFSAQEYSAEDYTPEAISSAISSLGAFSAYNQASSLSVAEQAYYSTAGYSGDGTNTGTTTTTATPSSSGYGFAETTAPGSTVYHGQPQFSNEYTHGYSNDYTSAASTQYTSAASAAPSSTTHYGPQYTQASNPSSNQGYNPNSNQGSNQGSDQGWSGNGHGGHPGKRDARAFTA